MNHSAVHKPSLGASLAGLIYRLQTHRGTTCFPLWDDTHPCAAAAAHRYSLDATYRASAFCRCVVTSSAAYWRQNAGNLLPIKCHPEADPSQTSASCATLIDSSPLITLPQRSYLIAATLYSHDPGYSRIPGAVV